MTYPTPITGDFDPTDPCRGHAAAIMMSSARSRLPHASKGDQAMTEIDLIVSQIGAARRYTEGLLGDIDVSKTVGWPLAVPEGVINDLGYAALSGEKTQDAIALFRRNVEANPNSADAHHSLSEGYAKAGMRKDATRAADRAAALAVEFDHPNRAHFIDRAKTMNDRLRQGSEDPR